MNSFSKSGVKQQLKLIASVALIVWWAKPAFGQEAEQTFLNTSSYTATTGGSISGSATIAEDINCSGGSDYTWTDYVDDDGADSWCINLVGTGTNPIISSDVNYFGTCCYSLTFPEPANSGNETQGFTISCTNTALNYDKTGTISVDTDCGELTSGHVGSASVTIYNMASVMNVAILSGGTNYSGDYIIRGEGNQTNYIHIYRATGDTLNQRTVTYVLSGNAVSNVDWTGPLTNSVTIPQGTNSVVIPVKAVQNTNIIGTRFLTLTLTSGYPSAGTNEFTENQYDLAGNLVLSEHNSSSGGVVTTWASSSSTHDGLNRMTSTTDRDSAVTYYAYDPLNDLTNRAIPGGSQWQATYSSAGQLKQEQDFASGNAVRTTTYNYYSGGSPFAGLLYTRTDGMGTTCTYSYDDWLRTTNATCTGSLPELNLTTTWQYEPRGYLDGMTEQFANTNTGPSTSIRRNYDAYGELSGESVSDGSFSYGASQSWDVTGRRSGLSIGNSGYGFGYQGDGSMISAGGAGGLGAYSYSTAGILTNRSVGIRNTGITSLDGEGRPLSVNTTIDGESLTETLSYSGDGLLQSDTLNRPDFTDSRSYSYASMSRRLTYEQLNVSGSATWTNNFTYDNGTSAGPGALTQMGQANGSSGLWNGGVDAFSRINLETNNTFVYPAYGHVNGQASLTAWLDNVPISIAALGTNAMQWQANMELSSGSHQLTVAALHPSGRFTAWATNYFNNTLAYQQTVDSYDANGDITNRVWMNPSGTVERTQALSWDARGRLHAVTQRDAGNSGYNWSAVYDPFNRRISTITVLVTNGVVYPSSIQTINSYFDPQVEFLELGVSYGIHTEWKLYGPDMNGQYGGLNGVGGLDGVSPGLSLFNPTVSDIRGDILAYYDSSIGSVTWNAARPTGYGAVPNYRPVALADGATLAQSSAWRGHWVDITGYYNIGVRPYDPISGRWLTHDSLWNSRDPNYYTFCGGDPINSFDRDGRIDNATYIYQNTFGPIDWNAAVQNANWANTAFAQPPLTQDQLNALLPPSATVGIGIIDPTEIAAEQAYENEPTAQKVAQAIPFGDLGYQIYSDSASGNLDALGQDSQQVAADAIMMLMGEGLAKLGPSPEMPNTSAPENTSAPLNNGSTFGTTTPNSSSSTILGPQGSGQFVMYPNLGSQETATIVNSGEFVNRVYDSSSPAPGVSGPLGQSFSPGSGVPTTADAAVAGRGLNIYNQNNGEQAIIFQVQQNIPAIYRTSLGGTDPEVIIQPNYWNSLEPVAQYPVTPTDTRPWPAPVQQPAPATAK